MLSSSVPLRRLRSCTRATWRPRTRTYQSPATGRKKAGTPPVGAAHRVEDPLVRHPQLGVEHVALRIWLVHRRNAHELAHAVAGRSEDTGGLAGENRGAEG